MRMFELEEEPSLMPEVGLQAYAYMLELTCAVQRSAARCDACPAICMSGARGWVCWARRCGRQTNGVALSSYFSHEQGDRSNLRSAVPVELFNVGA